MAKVATIVCYLELQTKDAEVTLMRVIIAPFAPTVGLRLVFDDEQSEYMDCDRVEWSVENDAYWVTESRNWGDDCPCRLEERCCTFKPESWKGWTVESERRGEDRFSVEDWQFP